ncbi:MAG TPA: hypothetical protein VK716_07000 [Terracidiphilus sp.]|jgi:hypothetical protein|nr:hypothetical protein [Terracidiphilus sp.]
MQNLIRTKIFSSRAVLIGAVLALMGCGKANDALIQNPITITLPISTVTVTQDGPTVIIPIQITSTSETALVSVTGLPGGVAEKYAATDTSPSGSLFFTADGVAMTGTFMPTITVMSAGEIAKTQFTLIVKMS